jgi:hypothetical protein
MMPAFYGARDKTPLRPPPLTKTGCDWEPGSNLSLAARPRVGHIGLNGAVAEWLKAAVC